ncbi:MAG: HEAT repeat domain-containing protein, partial [Planctomycetota bacterium]
RGYIRILSKIPPVPLLERLDRNINKYTKIIKSQKNYITYFLNLLTQSKFTEFSTYLNSTIKNKKEVGIKILVGLLFNLSTPRDISKTIDYFLMDNVAGSINTDLKLKSLSFPLLAIELYNLNKSLRAGILRILSKAELPSSFFCKRYKEENLSNEELQICLTNFGREDKNWIKEILYRHDSFGVKGSILNTALAKKITGMGDIFIDYAKKYLLEEKTNKDAVELTRMIIAYLGENPGADGLKFLGEITLNSKLPWILRHDAITSLDMMKEFNNETFFIYLKVLKDSNQLLRAHAVNFLGNLLLPQALSYLKEVAEKEPYTIARAYAIEAIGKIGQKEENRFLLKFLKDPAPLIRFVTLQQLLKNNYPKVNLGSIIKFLQKNENIFIAEDWMARTLCFEILQDFASPDITGLLIDIATKEQNPNILVLINNTLNQIFSLDYKIEEILDDNARNNMIRFWTRIYNIYKKAISRRISLNAHAMKNIITLVNNSCNEQKDCEIKIKQLFLSYTNKLYKKIKNFTTYNIFVFLNGEEVMRKKFDNKSVNFSFSFIYPKQPRIRILIKTHINDRKYVEKIEIQ